MTWIQTLTGKKFDLLDPKPSQVDMLDIACALARISRFGGHTPTPYSVAQHSVYVAKCLPPELKFAGLLHDAAEAYIGDIVQPLKQLLGPEIRYIEARILCAICTKFECAYSQMQHPLLKEIDLKASIVERNRMMLPPPEPWAVEPDVSDMLALDPPWDFHYAANIYLERFNDLRHAG